MTSFLLKIMGMFTMLCDHIGDSLVGHFSFLNYIGRISFPLFAFQITQGYQHTQNLKKYMLKLFIFACISQIPFMVFLSTFQTGDNLFTLNIFFTFLLGILAMFIYDACQHKIRGWLCVILISILGSFIKVDYGAFGILLIFCFYIFQNKKVYLALSTFILAFCKYLPEMIAMPQFITHYLGCSLFTCFSLIFILSYNHKEGPKTKYLFYIFYPTHLIALYLLHSLL